MLKLKNILLPLLQANSDQARTASIDAIRAEKTRPLGELSAPYHHWLYALGESTGYNRIRRSMEEHYFPQDRPMMEEFYKREVADIGGLRGSAGFEMMMASLESDQTRTAIAPMLNRLGMHQQAGLYDVPKAYIDQRETEERNRKAANIRIPQPKNPVW